MAFITKRSNSPVWYAVWPGPEGKQVRRSTGLKGDSDRVKRKAQSKADQWEGKDRELAKSHHGVQRAFQVVLEAAARAASEGRLTLAKSIEYVERLHQLANPEFRPATVAEYFDRWIGEQDTGLSDASRANNRDSRRRFVAALGAAANAPISHLTPKQVKAAIDAIHRSGVRATTANNDLATVRRLLEAATVEKLVVANVAKQVKKLDRIDSTERAPFEPAEVRKLIQTAAADKALIKSGIADEWSGAITVAAHTGLRLRDVVSLSRANIDGTRIVIRPAKTARIRRTVIIPLSPPVLRWIGDRDGDFFPRLRKVQKSNLSMQFTKIMERAEVDRDVVMPGGIAARRSFHSLRHSFTSWLTNSGVAPDVRMALTGHSTAKIHEGYSHHDAALDQAVACLPAL